MQGKSQLLVLSAAMATVTQLASIGTILDDIRPVNWDEPFDMIDLYDSTIKTKRGHRNGRKSRSVPSRHRTAGRVVRHAKRDTVSDSLTEAMLTGSAAIRYSHKDGNMSVERVTLRENHDNDRNLHISASS